MSKEILNGTIRVVKLTNVDYNCLTMNLTIEHQKCIQCFGGFNLYSPDFESEEDIRLDHAGQFIWKVMEITESHEISEIMGKNVRVEIEDNKIHSIGHIIYDIWFNPTLQLFKENEK